MNLLANSIVVTVNRLVVVEQTTTKSSILSVCLLNLNLNSIRFVLRFISYFSRYLSRNCWKLYLAINHAIQATRPLSPGSVWRIIGKEALSGQGRTPDSRSTVGD